MKKFWNATAVLANIEKFLLYFWPKRSFTSLFDALIVTWKIHYSISMQTIHSKKQFFIILKLYLQSFKHFLNGLLLQLSTANIISRWSFSICKTNNIIVTAITSTNLRLSFFFVYIIFVASHTTHNVEHPSSTSSCYILHLIQWSVQCILTG